MLRGELEYTKLSKEDGYNSSRPTEATSKAFKTDSCHRQYLQVIETHFPEWGPISEVYIYIYIYMFFAFKGTPLDIVCFFAF